MPLPSKARNLGIAGLPVTGAGGNDDGPGAHRAAIGELQAESIAWFLAGLAAVEPCHLQRNGDLGAELQRLIEGPPSQGHAGDAARETKIILDASRRTCLSAEGALVEHKHG